MTGRHNLACQPIRNLLVDYLRERQPALDYTSLEQLARRLGMFWADLEAHHPGIDCLHLSAEVADAWKQRMETKPVTVTMADGTKTMTEAERICHRGFLTPVRAFYLDLAQWAVEDPGRWARWAAPCPVGLADTIQGKVQRHRKSRMDARTRERLPALPAPNAAPPPSAPASPIPLLSTPSRPSGPAQPPTGPAREPLLSGRRPAPSPSGPGPRSVGACSVGEGCPVMPASAYPCRAAVPTSPRPSASASQNAIS